MLSVKCAKCGLIWDPVDHNDAKCPVCAANAEIERLKKDHFSMSSDLLETIATRARLDGLLVQAVALMKEEVTATLCLMAPRSGPDSTKIVVKSWCENECWWCRCRKFIEMSSQPIAFSDWLKRRTPEELALIPPLTGEEIANAIRRAERDRWLALHPTMPVPPEFFETQPEPKPDPVPGT